METHKSYFMCFTVRSGSTLLCELLSRTNLAGKPDEHFNHHIHQGNPQGEIIPDYQGYVTQTLTKATTANGVFGTKIGGGVWHDFIRRIHTIDGLADKPLDQALNGLFPDLRYIWLTRRNKVRQAVSHWMAIQTGNWHAPDTQTAEPEYNYDAIDYLLNEIVIREAVWGDYFAEYQIRPHIVVYEDFVQDKESTVRGILDFLDIDISAPLEIQNPFHKQLANDLSEEWIQRYRQEKQKDWWATFW